MTNKFSIMMPSICGSAVGKLLHVTVLAPRNLRKIIIIYNNNNNNIIYLLTAVGLSPGGSTRS
jgi:hypothetical protein